MADLAANLLNERAMSEECFAALPSDPFCTRAWVPEATGRYLSYLISLAMPTADELIPVCEQANATHGFENNLELRHLILFYACEGLQFTVRPLLRKMARHLHCVPQITCNYIPDCDVFAVSICCDGYKDIVTPCSFEGWDDDEINDAFIDAGCSLEDRLVVFTDLVSRVIMTHRFWCQSVVMHQYGLRHLRSLILMVTSNQDWLQSTVGPLNRLKAFIRSQTLNVREHVASRIAIHDLDPIIESLRPRVCVSEVMELLAVTPNLWMDGHNMNQFYASMQSPTGAIF
jgi:hypothetical protein